MVFDVQEEGENFPEHCIVQQVTHTVYPRSAMRQWAFDLSCDTKFACKHFHCANHSPYNQLSC